MPSFLDRITRFTRTPQGRQAAAKAAARAQELAKDPATRAKLEKLRDEVTKRAGRRRPPT